MVFLMSVAFIPFPTAILSEYGNRTATIFYALTMAVTGFFSWLVWWYASDHNRLLDVTFKPPERWYSLRALMVSLVFVLSIGIALFNADLARLSWLFVVVVSMRMR
jgi:uncharacterized membrane protein